MNEGSEGYEESCERFSISDFVRCGLLLRFVAEVVECAESLGRFRPPLVGKAAGGQGNSRSFDDSADIYLCNSVCLWSVWGRGLVPPSQFTTGKSKLLSAVCVESVHCVVEWARNLLQCFLCVCGCMVRRRAVPDPTSSSVQDGQLFFRPASA